MVGGIAVNTLSQCWKQLFSLTIILNIIMETKILILIIGVLMPLSAIPPTMDKQLVNFITYGCESSAPFFVIYKAGHEPTPYW
jgi:fumarate reductase subunit D